MSGVLVTGAGGMLGQAVVKALTNAGAPAHGLARAELDIGDEAAVGAALEGLAPSAIINCAAWTDVDGAESDRDGAYATNAKAVECLARAAAKRGASIVHVSTDYVFDGRGRRPYVESDPTGPQTVYGASKLAGERAVLEAGERNAVVRTSWLFGAGGRNFVDSMLALAAEGREELAIVTDQEGCPTWIGHLAPALVLIAQDGLGGLVHVAGGGSCTWNDLAREAFAQAGVEIRVLPSTTAEQGRPAPRPAYSVLGSERTDAPRLPDWREGVREHLAARVADGAGA